MQAFQLMIDAGYLVESLMHIGANVGQERLIYAASGASPCVYVEPISPVAMILQANLKDLPGHIAVKALCSDDDGAIVNFNISSNGGESSSMFELGDHALNYPFVSYTTREEMITEKLDSLMNRLKLKKTPNLLIIDTQGADLKVLKGAVETLKSVDGIFVEVSETPLYENGCTQEEITAFLKPLSFHMRWMTMNAKGHGDAFYCRTKEKPKELPVYSGNKALNKPARQSSHSTWSKPDDALGAVNGVRNGGYGFHTDEENCPWWEIDLLEAIDLKEIRIFNRIDGGRQRSRTLQIHISQNGQIWKHIHDQSGYTFGGIDGKPLRVELQGETGRYVRLGLNDRTSLHLDEVEIY